MIILKYRKPAYHKNFPWLEERQNAADAIFWMNKMGKEYEFMIFREISKAELKELVQR